MPVSNNFTLGAETEAFNACSIVIKGDTYIVGGKRRYNQVSTKYSYQMKIKSYLVEQNGIM